MKRLSTGVEGLDNIIQGGYPENRVIVISGSPGSGKTTVSMQFLIAGAMANEQGMFITTLENPRTVIENMSRYSLNLQSFIKDKSIIFVDMGPNIEAFQGSSTSIVPTSSFVINKITEYVKKWKITRLGIDSSSVIKYSTTGKISEQKELGKFIRKLKDLGCTTILISELSKSEAYSMEHFLSHGVIFMHNFLFGDSMVRSIQIIKMSGTKHDCDMHVIKFTKKGVLLTGKKVLLDV